MKLIFERSRPGRGNDLLPSLNVPTTSLPEKCRRRTAPRLPDLEESDLSRHYQALTRRAFSVCDDFYPLGSCTMKYNPRLGEGAAVLLGFTGLHSLRPARTVQGAQAALARAKHLLCETTGMDAVTLRPAAGAHGELLGLLLIKAYHHSRGGTGRTMILVPDSTHDTNPASAAMVGFTVKNIPSAPEGLVDLEALQATCSPDAAGLMLTNPNAMGLFERNIPALTALVHAAGDLVYYGGASLSAIIGVTWPSDMGFDMCHLNLYKTFTTPHDGSGLGSGPVGYKAPLAPFLPGSALCRNDGEHSIGQVRVFHTNFLVVVKALAYLLRLGNTGVAEAAHTTVLNANYLRRRLERAGYTVALPGLCIHEFVLTLEELKKETGVSALDVAKSMLDTGIHSPAIYFPLIVHETLMFEPTETKSPKTLGGAVVVLAEILRWAREKPEALHTAPANTSVDRPDETVAARHPVVWYAFPEGWAVYELIVIGGGLGGYATALRVAQSGLSVALFEPRQVGSTYLNRGCVSTEALLRGAEPGCDWPALATEVERTVSTLRAGQEKQLRAAGVELIPYRAMITGPHTVKAGGAAYEATHTLVAAGSEPVLPPISDLDTPGVVTSNGLLSSLHPLDRLTIIGGGVIGVELACVWAAVGARVAILGAAPRLLPTLERELGRNLAAQLRQDGVKVFTRTGVTGVVPDPAITFTHRKEAYQLKADTVLVATEQRPATGGLFARSLLPELERGFLRVDGQFRTSIPSLCATGDATDGTMLAHKAEAEGRFAADLLLGRTPLRGVTPIPVYVYTNPELVQVGLTADEVRTRDIPYATGRCVLRDNVRTLIGGGKWGFAKLVFHQKSHALLGTQLCYYQATDLISEPTLAVTLELTAEQLLRPVRPHPTFGEAISEAVEMVFPLS